MAGEGCTKGRNLGQAPGLAFTTQLTMASYRRTLETLDTLAMNYERLLIRLRAHPGLFSEDDQLSDRIGNLIVEAKGRIIEQRKTEQVRIVGPYSGLTRSELVMTGTCEPDWY